MKKELEQKLAIKYPFLRPKQDPKIIEDFFDIESKFISEDELRKLEESSLTKGISKEIRKRKEKPTTKIYGKDACNPPFISDLMVFGLECGDGWYNLLDDLCCKIQKHLDENPQLESFKMRQIKEKFGELSFYYQGGDDYISKVVREAEQQSYKTCELCGNDGNPCRSETGWLKTLCKKHSVEHNYKEVQKISTAQKLKPLARAENIKDANCKKSKNKG